MRTWLDWISGILTGLGSSFIAQWLHIIANCSLSLSLSAISSSTGIIQNNLLELPPTMFNHNCSPFLTRLFSCFWQVCSQRVWTKESKSSFSFFLFLDWNYWNDNGVIENYDEVGECIFSFLLKFLCFLLSLCDWIKGSKRRRASRHPAGGGGRNHQLKLCSFLLFIMRTTKLLLYTK